jgi:23S rRNA U2552 (ribose-2'-O)-methylase RlmE/FtsJ
MSKKGSNKNNKKLNDGKSNKDEGVSKTTKLGSKKILTTDEIKDIPVEYKDSNDFDTLSYEIKSSGNIFDSEAKPEYSHTIDFPAINLGFQHYIHQTYSKNVVFKQFEGRKKVYNIINDLEITIDDDNFESIEKAVEKKFKTKIVGRAFYKLYEIASIYKFLDDKSAITTLHINDKNGGFAQAVMLYRKNNKDNINYTSTDNSNLIDKSLKINQLKNPDIKADVVTAYGEQDWKSGYTAESEAFGMIYDQIKIAVNNQKEGGTFVMKIFESFTNVSCRFVELLSKMYDKTYIVKPMTSRTSSPEKFLVCVGFKGKKNQIEKINAINKGNGLVNLFPDHNITIDGQMKQLNIELSNKHFICLNRMFSYIASQNFFGDEYQKNLQKQKNNSEKWIKKFL